MERKVPFVVGEHYHAYTRGVDKMVVFDDVRDFERFQLLLYLCNGSASINMRELFSKYKGEPFATIFEKYERGETLVDVLAYALMPNHIHVLLHEKTENGISRFMLKLMTAYSMYYNVKNDRSGPLFTRPFRSRHVDSDPYLRWVFSYIHLNPLELHQHDWKSRGIDDIGKAKRFMAEYAYSSLPDSFAPRPASRILAPSDSVVPLDGIDSLIAEFSSSDHQHKGEPFA